MKPCYKTWSLLLVSLWVSCVLCAQCGGSYTYPIQEVKTPCEYQQVTKVKPQNPFDSTIPDWSCEKLGLTIETNDGEDFFSVMGHGSDTSVEMAHSIAVGNIVARIADLILYRLVQLAKKAGEEVRFFNEEEALPQYLDLIKKGKTEFILEGGIELHRFCAQIVENDAISWHCWVVQGYPLTEFIAVKKSSLEYVLNETEDDKLKEIARLSLDMEETSIPIQELMPEE